MLLFFVKSCFRLFQMDRGQFLLQGVEGEVADQVDGAGKHQLQAVHDSQ
jgi:hypothetical protein